jgi:hypothetical protein
MVCPGCCCCLFSYLFRHWESVGLDTGALIFQTLHDVDLDEFDITDDEKLVGRAGDLWLC